MFFLSPPEGLDGQRDEKAERRKHTTSPSDLRFRAITLVVSFPRITSFHLKPTLRTYRPRSHPPFCHFSIYVVFSFFASFLVDSKPRVGWAGSLVHACILSLPMIRNRFVAMRVFVFLRCEHSMRGACLSLKILKGGPQCDCLTRLMHVRNGERERERERGSRSLRKA